MWDGACVLAENRGGDLSTSSSIGRERGLYTFEDLVKVVQVGPGCAERGDTSDMKVALSQPRRAGC